MTDYVAAYDNPQSPYYREARRLADELRTETNLSMRGVEAGVLRWKSNNRVVPRDCAALAHSIGIGIDLDACNNAREREDAAAISRYRRARANRPKDQESEERYARRAAFGPGHTVVNVFTGERIVT